MWCQSVRSVSNESHTQFGSVGSSYVFQIPITEAASQDPSLSVRNGTCHLTDLFHSLPPAVPNSTTVSIFPDLLILLEFHSQLPRLYLCLHFHCPAAKQQIPGLRRTSTRSLICFQSEMKSSQRAEGKAGNFLVFNLFLFKSLMETSVKMYHRASHQALCGLLF